MCFILGFFYSPIVIFAHLSIVLIIKICRITESFEKEKKKTQSQLFTELVSLCFSRLLYVNFKSWKKNCVALIQQARLSAKLYQTVSNRDRYSSCLHGVYNSEDCNTELFIII